jgi:hypothetical protein
MSFGAGHSQLWQLTEYWLYFQKMIFVTKGEETKRLQARQSWKDRAVGTYEDALWNLQFISPTTIIVPDILYTINLCIGTHVIQLGYVLLQTTFWDQQIQPAMCHDASISWLYSIQPAR